MSEMTSMSTFVSLASAAMLRGARVELRSLRSSAPMVQSFALPDASTST
jgi:hypothetical protein